jgi:hypothetical protein
VGVEQVAGARELAAVLAQDQGALLVGGRGGGARGLALSLLLLLLLEKEVAVHLPGQTALAVLLSVLEEARRLAGDVGVAEVLALALAAPPDDPFEFSAGPICQIHGPSNRYRGLHGKVRPCFRDPSPLLRCASTRGVSC